MTKVRILSAAAVFALMGGTAAMATEPMAANSAPAKNETQTETYQSSPMMTDKAAAADEAGVDASTLAPSMDQAPGTVSVDTVTNGPVPDTPENRARFGGPNSRSGRMTAPIGN